MKLFLLLLIILFLSSCNGTYNIRAQEALMLSQGIGTPYHTLKGCDHATK